MKFPVDQPYQITTKFSSAHPGIDIAPIPAGSTGRVCHAPENGTIVASGYVATLEGNYIIMQGASGMFYYFGHFASRLVGVGASVSEGQSIGVIGMTGLATGIHTHHEVRRTRAGSQIDPEKYYATVNQGDNMGTYPLDRPLITSMAKELLNRNPTEAELSQQEGKPFLDLWRAWTSDLNPERFNIQRLTDLGIQADREGWKPGQGTGGTVINKDSVIAYIQSHTI